MTIYLVGCIDAERGRNGGDTVARSVGWRRHYKAARPGHTGRGGVIAMESPLKGVSVARARHALPSVAAAAVVVTIPDRTAR